MIASGIRCEFNVSLNYTSGSPDRFVQNANIYHIFWIYIYGILLSHIKECNNAICSNMNGARDDHIKSFGHRKTNII